MSRALIYVSFALLVLTSCTATNSVKLPATMPPGCNIVLYESYTDSSYATSYSIDASGIIKKRFRQNANIWHSGNDGKEETKISVPKSTIEALYQLILENHFDEIDAITPKENKPKEKDLSISVFFDKRSVVVYNGLLQLSKADELRFETIYDAILALIRNFIPS